MQRVILIACLFVELLECENLISSVETFPAAEITDQVDEDSRWYKNRTHFVTISTLEYAIPARSLYYRKILPPENFLNILPNFDHVLQFPEVDDSQVLAAGISNHLRHVETKYREDFDRSEFPSFCEDSTVCQKVNTKLQPISSQHRDKRSVKVCEYEVTIVAFGSNYTLCLFKKELKDEPIVDQSYTFVNVTVFNKDNTSTDTPVSSMDIFFATGHLKGEEYGSVSGFIMNNHFYGTVYLKDSVHFLEPHGRKSKDMHILGDGLKTLLHRRPLEENPILTSRQNISNRTSKRKMCELTIVADHLFFQDIGESSVEKTVLQMLWHVKEANAIFQSKDFDDDGTSECIGFSVAEISIFTSDVSGNNLLAGNFSVPEDFLKRFSRYNFDGYCLGVLFTNRAFSELVLGLSWRGNPKKDGVGGICQNRVLIKSDRNAYSFNALFISLKSSQEDRIPLRMGVLNLVHELMHSFGAKHDPEASLRPECTPDDKWLNGRYLMSKYSNDGHKLNHMILSPCTKALIRTNLEAPNRISCLKTLEDPYCGDMVVQSGEECDCGTILQCLASRSCCVPPDGYKNLRGCTINSVTEHCSKNSLSEGFVIY